MTLKGIVIIGIAFLIVGGVSFGLVFTLVNDSYEKNLLELNLEELADAEFTESYRYIDETTARVTHEFSLEDNSRVSNVSENFLESREYSVINAEELVDGVTPQDLGLLQFTVELEEFNESISLLSGPDQLRGVIENETYSISEEEDVTTFTFSSSELDERYAGHLRSIGESRFINPVNQFDTLSDSGSESLPPGLIFTAVSELPDIEYRISLDSDINIIESLEVSVSGNITFNYEIDIDTFFPEDFISQIDVTQFDPEMTLTFEDLSTEISYEDLIREDAAPDIEKGALGIFLYRNFGIEI